MNSASPQSPGQDAGAPVTIHRKDYRQPPYWIETVDLRFELSDEGTLVTATMALVRNAGGWVEGEPLVLAGEEIELRSIRLDGRELDASEYEIQGEDLALHGLPESCTLETVVAIDPDGNTSLSGLYRTSGNYCTQCEAEGFRRITYFLDRPDVMARYSTTIVADPASCPVMLSNGNRVEEGTLEDGRHWVRWEDPFKKPSYLFALVAGNLACHSGSYTTMSGREVALEFWVEPHEVHRCEHALRSLQESMKWDEDTFGLEYDLDIYMVVAVGDFNMGAMENKGLNVFNSKYVLATKESATDMDFQFVQGVIGHEYFHNWTGNRVTCKDWFQLTLKEGLTVFRDQQFTADMTSAAVKRIDDVRALRIRQFPEDSGPMSHPIRPESYISMDNFYTATVYNKGAEIIRMYHTLLSPEGFRRGMDLYFERHDGQAVSCDDFLSAMAESNGRDLTQFSRWYSTPGTPRLLVEGCYDPKYRTYTMAFTQKAPLDAEGKETKGFEPLHIPIAVGLLEPEGKDLPLMLLGENHFVEPGTRVLELTEARQVFTFQGIHTTPVASVLRAFSAPLIVEQERTREQMAFLMAHDSDSFNRWEAGQQLATDIILALVEDWEAERELELDPVFIEAFGNLLTAETLDNSLRALALQLPAEQQLAQSMAVIQVDALHNVREFVRQALAKAHRETLLSMYTRLHDTSSYEITSEAIANRRLKNVALGYLSALEDSDVNAIIVAQFDGATNMTDAEAALGILLNVESAGLDRGNALHAFYCKWQSDPLVIDKWFTLQASSCAENACAHVALLSKHPDFSLTNPNRARSLIGAFASGNQIRFHQADGAGYRFVTDQVILLDSINPQVAARMVSTFNSWRRFDEGRQKLMVKQLQRVAAVKGLSKDTFEIVTRALGDAAKEPKAKNIAKPDAKAKAEKADAMA
ncbi:MAG: aminopeptidase N [Planctomycetota bacterium]|jgi:aminopeptidase N